MAKFNVMKYLKKHQKVLMVVGLVLLALLVYKHITSCGCYNVEGMNHGGKCVRKDNIKDKNMFSRIAKNTGYSISEYSSLCSGIETEDECNNYVLQHKPGYKVSEPGACRWRVPSAPTPESTPESPAESTPESPAESTEAGIREFLRTLPGYSDENCNIPTECNPPSPTPALCNRNDVSTLMDCAACISEHTDPDNMLNCGLNL